MQSNEIWTATPLVPSSDSKILDAPNFTVKKPNIPYRLKLTIVANDPDVVTPEKKIDNESKCRYHKHRIY